VRNLKKLLAALCVALLAAACGPDAEPRETAAEPLELTAEEAWELRQEGLKAARADRSNGVRLRPVLDVPVHDHILMAHAQLNHWAWEREQAAKAAAARPKPAAKTGSAPAERPRPTGDVWWALGNCESGNNPKAVSSTGKYRGAFQFSIATWQGIGYAGDPIDHSYATQLEAAKKLQARSGWGQWPSCARKLGLI
jgi:hypothetical protein